MKSSLRNVYLVMALLQRMGRSGCWAFASRFNSRDPIVARNKFQSGFLQSKGAEFTSLRLSSDAQLAEIAEKSVSIAGQLGETSFGGLTFRDCTDRYKVIFVLGGPGAGKGTQSELLLENYPCVHLSAGQLLREEVQKENSPHSELIERCLTSGQIVPVEISLALLREAMQTEARKSTVFLVDGFPRNFDNLDGWTRCMDNVAVVTGVLFYQCPLEVLENRILERAKVSGRSDDNIDSLRKRFKTFEDETLPVIDTLRLVEKNSALRVYDIQSDQPVEDVWKETKKVMDDIVGEDVLAANFNLLKAIASSDVASYQNLCADEMIGDRDPASVLAMQEGELDWTSTKMSGAEIKFISGTKISVTYDITSERGNYKESRVWTHEANGWQMLHYSRAAIVERAPALN